MWPFSTRKPDQNLEKLEARLDKLERSHRETELEWNAMYEKFAKLYARLAKRAKSEAEAEDEAPKMPQNQRTTAPEGPDLTGPINPAAARLLAGGTLNGILPR